MIRSSSHGVSASDVTFSLARQQDDDSKASHGPLDGSRRLGNQPAAPIVSNVIVAPLEIGSSPTSGASRPESSGGSDVDPPASARALASLPVPSASVVASMTGADPASGSPAPDAPS